MIFFNLIDNQRHSFQLMRFDVTMKKPIARIIGDEINDDVPTWGNNHCVLADRPVGNLDVNWPAIGHAPHRCLFARLLAFQVWRCCNQSTIFVILSVAYLDDVKAMAVQMDWVWELGIGFHAEGGKHETDWLFVILLTDFNDLRTLTLFSSARKACVHAHLVLDFGLGSLSGRLQRDIWQDEIPTVYGAGNLVAVETEVEEPNVPDRLVVWDPFRKFFLRCWCQQRKTVDVDAFVSGRIPWPVILERTVDNVAFIVNIAVSRIFIPVFSINTPFIWLSFSVSQDSDGVVVFIFCASPEIFAVYFQRFSSN